MVKRSDCRTKKHKGQSRSPAESWLDETRYQMTKIQEAAAAIRGLARRKIPSWTPDHISQLANQIDAAANEIRVAYQEPARIETFQFTEPAASPFSEEERNTA